MRISIDAQGGIAYIRLSTEEVHTTQTVSSAILADYDKQGKTVGIEVLLFPLLK